MDVQQEVLLKMTNLCNTTSIVYPDKICLELSLHFMAILFNIFHCKLEVVSSRKARTAINTKVSQMA